MAGHQEVAHGFGVVVLQHVTYGKEVAERFGHLLAIDHNHAGVHPVIHILTVVRAGGLRDFVFMVREHQVRATAVNIEMAAELLAVHRGALDMPARTPVAPRRRPARLARLGHLPQHEIHRVTFAVGHFYARARLELFQILARKFAVIGVAFHREHHIAIARDIRMAACDQLLNDFNNFRNMLRRARLAVRAQNIQRIEIFVHLGDHAVHQRHKIFAILVRAFNNFVVNIGNVTHVFQLIAEKTQVARHDVKRDKRAAMADVTEVVNGNTTHVHADFPGMDRLKFLFLATHGIEDF
ncbi:hypothetical protein BN130_3809 [Cronobacter malonaticus 507]|nr:hypothetical protein BN130_3809 [Cronobacter malonaticus 507]